MTGSLLDAMSTRRAAFECSTSTSSTDRSGPARTSKSIRRKPIENRITSTAFIIAAVCAMFGESLAANAKSTAGEIDKVYGRPNIEPARPTNPGNGAAAYRRSGDSQLKSSNIVGAAHYYGSGSHLPPAPSSSIGYAPQVPSSETYAQHAPPAWNGNYAPPPSPTGNYAPPPSHAGHYVPPPNPAGNYVPPNRVVNYAHHTPPNPIANYVPPILTGNYVPPITVENYPPPISNGHYAPPIEHTGPFRYKDDKGCVKIVQYVHWPSLGYALRYYDKHYAAQPPAYSPDEEPPIHVNKKHVEGGKDDKKDGKKDDKKHNGKSIHTADFGHHEQKGYESKPLENYQVQDEHGSSVQYENPSNGGYEGPQDNNGYEGDGYVAPLDAKAKKYDEDYAPKPAEGYGFKKLIVPIHDVYNQKAHRPPTYDLSDLIFPADSYNNPPSLPHSADGYGDKTPVDQPYDSEPEGEYEPTGEIDSFGAIPYKEKKEPVPYQPNPSNLPSPVIHEEDYAPTERDEFGVLPYKEKKEPVSYQPNPSNPSNPPSPVIHEEDYAPTGRDEFGALPYKESAGGPPKEAYQSTASPYNGNSTGNGTAPQPLPQQSSLKETLGGGHAISSDVAVGKENSDEVDPMENMKNDAAGEPEAMFRSELDSVGEIDDNESPPGKSVISEAFLKGSKPRDDLAAKTEKEKPTSEVQSNKAVSDESSTLGTTTNHQEPSTTSSITMPSTDVAELARDTGNSIGSIESILSQKAIATNNLFVAETTINATTEHLPTTVVVTSSQDVSDASAAPVEAETSPTTTESAIARGSFNRQMTSEAVDEESTSKSREVHEHTNNFDDSTSPSIGHTTSASSTTIDVRSTSHLADELTTLTSTAIVEDSTISSDSNSSDAVTTQLLNDQPVFDSVSTTEAAVNSDGFLEIQSDDKLSTAGVMNSTADESEDAPSKGTGLDGRDKRNVSGGPLRSALGRGADVKNKPKDWVGMRPALFQRVLPGGQIIPDNGGATPGSLPPPPPPSPATSTPATPPPTLATANTDATAPTANFASALAQAEMERQKLAEPGPFVSCPGMRTQVGGSCSPFFTCNTNGKLLSCWDGEDNTSELVFDPTSQECRKFEAIPACTKETICAGKSGLTLIGGGCTRLAFNCPAGELTKCDAPEMAIAPAGECVSDRSVDLCLPLIEQLQNA